MLNEMLYILAVKWLIFCLIGGNEIDGRNNPMSIVDLQFVESILGISRGIHHAKMFPIKEISGLWVPYGEVGKKCFRAQRKSAFIAKRNVLGE